MVATVPHATGLIAEKGIELLTYLTPNGHKPALLLEELRAAYGVDYTVQTIDLQKKVQKEPWFLELNPNGKIPVIVDHDRGITLAESSAILSYLAHHYDPELKFQFQEPEHVPKMHQWLAFSQGDLSPMTVVNIRFYRLLPERHAFPIAFFHREMERLYGVLELGLTGRDYLVGDGRGKYSIADMACWTMVNTSIFIGVGELSPRWPNVAAWRDRIWARPAAKRAVNVPVPNVNGNEVVLRKLAEDEKFAKGHDELQMALNKALEEFPA